MRWKILVIFSLLTLTGCSIFSLSRQRAVVLFEEDAVYGTLPGQSYKVLTPDGKVAEVVFPRERYIIDASTMVKYEELQNRKTLKRMGITKKQYTFGGAIASFLGIVFWFLKNKKKKE